MADRIPLIVNTGDNQIQELATTDNLAFASKLLVTNSTDSTSKDTGSAIIDGGVGIEKNLHVGGNGIFAGSGTFGGGGTFGGTVTAPLFSGSATKIDINSDTGSTYRQIVFTAATAAGTNGQLFIDTASSATGIQFKPSDNTLRVDGDIIAFHSSDRRLKDNITPIPNALDKITSISGNTFNWNGNTENEGKGDTGVIAQEVEALDLPGVTTTRENGYKAVRYEKLIPLLIEAIKDLKAEVNELKSNTH